MIVNTPMFDRAVAVTPNDTTDIPTVDAALTSGRALWVGGAGNVKLKTPNGDIVTFNSVPAGTVLPVAANRVYATGTTATNIIALA